MLNLSYVSTFYRIANGGCDFGRTCILYPENCEIEGYNPSLSKRNCVKRSRISLASVRGGVSVSVFFARDKPNKTSPKSLSCHRSIPKVPPTSIPSYPNRRADTWRPRTQNFFIFLVAKWRKVVGVEGAKKDVASFGYPRQQLPKPNILFNQSHES